MDIPDSERAWARKLLRRTQQTDPIRDLAEEILQSKPVPFYALRRIRQALLDGSTTRWRQRAMACWLAGLLGPDWAEQPARTMLLGDVLANRYVESWFDSGVRRTAVAAVWAGAAAALYVLSRLLPHGLDPLSVVFGAACLGALAVLPALILLLPAVTPISAGIDAFRAVTVRTAAAAALGRIRDPAGVKDLAGALNDRIPAVRRAAESALLELLPLLTEWYYGRLGAETVPNLCGPVLYRGDLALVAELLGALEKIGDGRAVGPVTRLMLAHPDEGIRQLCERILPTLKARQANERASERLLRPAESTGQGASRLLRPSPGPTETVAEKLLRPADE